MRGGFFANNIWASYDALHTFRDDFEGGLYHYTSTKVLNSILDKGCFWASNLLYLNDKQEYRTGIKILESIFKGDDMQKYINNITHIGRNDPGIFSISFCSKEDILQQWITYAKESGVCIGLDKEIVLNKALLRSGGLPHRPYNFLPLAYEKNNQNSKLMDKGEIYSALRKGLAKAFFGGEVPSEWWRERPEDVEAFLQLLTSYYKEKGFYGEEEIRAAFLVKKDSEIKYFEHDTGVLRPYIEVCFLRKGPKGELKEEIPIRTIMVGPSGRQQAIFDSIIHRLSYGETQKIWKYDLQKKEEILQDFINSCLNEKSRLSDEKVKEEEIAYQIASDWARTADYSKYSVRIEGGAAIVKLEHDGQTIKVGKCEKEIAGSYLQHNHLSPQGIWVSKSKSTYLF